MESINLTPTIEKKIINGTEVIVRKKVRWMMVFYDAVLYLLCWLGTFLLQPILGGKIPAATIYLQLGVGAVLYLGLRL